jgi:hypothetical protein
MKKLLLILPFFCVVSCFAFGDNLLIKQFAVKENPFAKDEIAIVATDSLNNIREDVSGVFTFTINGFQEPLSFDKGTAFYHHKLNKSSFMYLKHQNEVGTSSILYYIFKRDTSLTPIHISWVLLLAIPIGLFLLGYAFKRFLIIAVIIFCIFLYFNYHNGLSIPTFFETIFDGLKRVF